MDSKKLPGELFLCLLFEFGCLNLYHSLKSVFFSLASLFVLGFKVFMSGVSNQSPRMSRGFDEPILWNGMRISNSY